MNVKLEIYIDRCLFDTHILNFATLIDFFSLEVQQERIQEELIDDGFSTVHLDYTGTEKTMILERI